MVVNIETIGWQDPLAHALVATLRTQFAHVWALPTAEPPDQFGNVVLMGATAISTSPRSRSATRSPR